jgi:triacylglycerol lipase
MMSDATPAASTPSSAAQAAMTLAGLAYGFPEKLPDYLKDARLATRGEWTPAWVPGQEDRGYFAYVARHGQAKRFVVAIRGTNPSLTAGFVEDVLHDLDVRVATPWAGVQDAATSRGAARGVERLLGLDARGTTLLEHLDATLPDGAELWVTGHSLGGCLASVLALRLAERYAPREVRVELMTFAAPSAGNAAFARVVETTFPTAQRYYNSRDLVPMAWHDLGRLPELYDAPGPRCSPILAAWATLAAKHAKELGYTQPGSGTALGPAPSAGQAAKGLLGKIRAFFRPGVFEVEALKQHDPNTYLDLMGAPRLPFQLPLRWLERKLGLGELLG